MNSFCDTVVVISLESRKKYIMDTMNSMGIRVRIFDAVLGSDLNQESLIDRGIIAKKNSFKNINEIACALSHLTVISNFYNDPYSKRLCVFEDDILPDPDYVSKFEKCISELPSDFEFLNMGRCYASCHLDKKVGENISISIDSLCSHSYIITKSGAKKILDNSRPISLAVDNYYATLMKDSSLKFYSSSPRIFNQIKAVDKTFKSSLMNNDDCPECREVVIQSWCVFTLFSFILILVIFFFLASKKFKF